MDRAGAATWPEQVQEPGNPGDELVLPSRAQVIGALATALNGQTGPVVLTGEPGVGKSWLCRRLREALPSDWRWAVVHLSPAIGEAGVHRLILDALGLEPLADPADARNALDAALTDWAEDGVRWALIVDEAQNAAPGVMEELRVLGQRLGEPGGLAAMLLVGQTALARRLATRAFAAMQARVAARVHLRGFDVEEFSRWLDGLAPAHAWSRLAAERLHRETGGNPRKTLAWVVRTPALREPKAAPAPRSVPTPVAAVVAAPAPAIAPVVAAARASRPRSEPDSPGWEALPIGGGKPPIQVGEGMIEVGWEPGADSHPEPEPDAEPEPLTPRVVAAESPRAEAAIAVMAPTEEIVDDHYAALQAWTEWAENQGREPVSSASNLAVTDKATLDSDDESADAPLAGHPGVWAEGQQEFAPYSQLFSRLRQTRDRS